MNKIIIKWYFSALQIYKHNAIQGTQEKEKRVNNELNYIPWFVVPNKCKTGTRLVLVFLKVDVVASRLAIGFSSEFSVVIILIDSVSLYCWLDIFEIANVFHYKKHLTGYKGHLRGNFKRMSIFW